MQRFRQVLGLAVAGLTPGAAGAALAQATPAGMWSTASDVKGGSDGIVEIREIDGEYVGIVRGIPADASPQDSLCSKCPGEQKGQRIVGLEIMSHMHATGTNQWGGGEILDPESGKTYRAKMSLSDDGTKLIVRGFIGFSLFGRSQTWTRLPDLPSR